MSKRKLIIAINVALLLAALWGISMVLSDTSLAAQGPDAAAHQGLAGILRAVSNLGFEKYGFKDKSEITSATLGHPYAAYVLSPEAVMNFGQGKLVAGLTEPEQWWEYPVMVNGEARGLLTVAQQNGQWQVVGFGALAVSQRLARLQRALATSGSAGAVSNVQVRILNVYPLHGSFALIRRDGRESLVYLQSYPDLFQNIDRTGVKEYAPEELMPQIAHAFDQMGLSATGTGVYR